VKINLRTCPVCGAGCRKKRYCIGDDIPYSINYKIGVESLIKCGKCHKETLLSLWKYAYPTPTSKISCRAAHRNKKWSWFPVCFILLVGRWFRGIIFFFD